MLDSLADLIHDIPVLAPILALLAGVLVSFSPCSLSSIPLVMGYVGGYDATKVKRSFLLSLLFAGGSALTYTALGVGAALLGQMFRLAGQWWYLLLGVLLVMMTLEWWHVIHWFPTFQHSAKKPTKGYLGAFIAGLVAGLFASPCSTPVLIVILTMVSAEGSLWYGIILLLCYSLGHSILVVLAGTSVGLVQKLNHSAHYGKVTKISNFILGLLMLALALYFFYLGF